jgi:hypothetical protein
MTGVLDIRCGEFTTVGYKRETETAMYEGEQKRLLYVATTRARDHLVLSLYHGKDDCLALRILKHLGVRPELSRELVIEVLEAGPRGEVAAAEAVVPATEDAAMLHRDRELAFQTQRASLIQQLANQRLVAPSSLAHLSETEQPDPPPEPDPNNTVRRMRKGRAGTRVGNAVHAVLQVIDLATLAQLEALAEAAARDEDISDSIDQIKDYVRNAAASAPVKRALASGRYWPLPCWRSLSRISHLDTPGGSAITVALACDLALPRPDRRFLQPSAARSGGLAAATTWTARGSSKSPTRRSSATPSMAAWTAGGEVDSSSRNR